MSTNFSILVDLLDSLILGIIASDDYERIDYMDQALAACLKYSRDPDTFSAMETAIIKESIQNYQDGILGENFNLAQDSVYNMRIIQEYHESL